MNRVISFFIVLCCCFSSSIFSQEILQHRSVHQQELEYYNAHPEAIHPPAFQKIERPMDLAKVGQLTNVVYGFHPYWQNGSESNYCMSLLSHLVYFSAEVDTNGNFSSTHSWSTAAVVTSAQSAGLKVHLCVTLFSNHAKVLTNSSRRATLINNIITKIDERNADGCNIDFESMTTSDADSFRTFIKQLGDSLAAHNKDLTVELPAVDWSTGAVLFGTAFFSLTQSVVDYYFLMAYDYWWSGSSTAGPVAPLTTGTSIWHVTRSIDTYLSRGCPASKLIGGFPYYGYEWPVADTARKSTVVSSRGSGTSKLYSTVQTVLPTIGGSDKFFDAQYNTAWYRYDSSSSGKWRQCWYDDSTSLAKKYDSVKIRSLAGVGMWALGYDGTYPELWRLLKAKFATQTNSQFTVLSNFEESNGKFDKTPTYSGSTVGISKLSTSGWTDDCAYNGLGSLKVVLKDSTTISTNWTVRLLSGSGARSNNTPLSSSGYVGFWLKTSSAPTGAQVALTIDDRSTETELSSKQTVINDGEWHLYQWNLPGSGWSSFASGNGAIDSSTVTMDAVMFYASNGSPDWTLYVDDVAFNSPGALPVQLFSFSVWESNGSVSLAWTTQTEANCYGFDVERKTIGDQQAIIDGWTKIGFVRGSGTSSVPHNYSLTDANVTPGHYAYRLKQIDNDGSCHYYQSIDVVVGTAPLQATLSNYPNPFNPSTTIQFSVPRDQHVIIRVYNQLGQEVGKIFDADVKTGRYYQIYFDGIKLASGMYVYTLETDRERLARRMLILK